MGKGGYEMNKNVFAKTPPMGWNSYDYYDTSVTEEEVRANAKFMAEHLKQYGWEYIVIDIEWYANDAGTRRAEYQYIPFGNTQMDEWGRFQPSSNRFPSSADGTGFKKLAEYIHELGLKFGIHIMRGIPRKAAEKRCRILGTEFTANDVADPSSICGWNPDMYGVRNTEAGQAYYDSLISMYAGWGVDFIKCDDICDSWMYRGENFNGWFETQMLHKAIEKCGRPIVLSLSPGPAHIDRAYQYCQNANMWRITDDFWDNWELLKNMFWRCEMWQDHVKEGCFPDCDMLPLGKLGKGFGNGERDCSFTREEQKTMMTLWCMFRSPLMLGAEMTKLDDWTMSLLTNKELLSLLGENQEGRQLVRTDEYAIWKNVNQKTKEIVVAFFNLAEKEQELTLSLEDLQENMKNDQTYTLEELWEHNSLQAEKGEIKVTVVPHGVKVYQIKK